jgi:hypothetical protein
MDFVEENSSNIEQVYDGGNLEGGFIEETDTADLNDDFVEDLADQLVQDTDYAGSDDDDFDE